jgi:hypothetical protein
MNTQSKGSEYMLLFRGTDWHRGLSPEEIQKVVAQWKAWFDRLTDQGIAKAGHPLECEAKIVSAKNGRVVVADGPFAEAKETIGGYFFLNVGSVDEAVAIAKQCPGLPHGAIVEVRPVAAECPLSQEVAANGQLAGATA